MTSWHWKYFVLLALCVGYPSVTSGFRSQMGRKAVHWCLFILLSIRSRTKRRLVDELRPRDVHVTPLSMRWARVKSQSTPLFYLWHTKQNTIRKLLVMRPSLCNNATIIFCPLHSLIPTHDGPWGSLHGVSSQSVHSISRLISLFRVIS